MKCPVCGYIFKSGNICPDCGTDIILYHKTRTISDRLYNEGLRCANERDLTGAIDNLKKSVMVNKFNTKARNLLGLVYYEKGLVADALREWVMSSNLNKNDKTAAEYMEKISRVAVPYFLRYLTDGTLMINIHQLAGFINPCCIEVIRESLPDFLLEKSRQILWIHINDIL